MKQIHYHLFETKTPPKDCLTLDNYDGWNNYSYPLGNGFFGACIFGLVNNERVQITSNAFANPYSNLGKNGNCGLMNFLEIYLHFNHTNVKEYKKELDIDHSIFKLDYIASNIKYHREAFLSYPDNVMVMKLTASRKKSLSFSLECLLPYIRDYCQVKEDKFKRDGVINVNQDTITFKGKLHFYNVDYAGVIKVKIKDGKLTNENNKLTVTNASEATIYFSCLTNYRLSPQLFLKNHPLLKSDATLLKKITSTISQATQYDYEIIYQRHLKDYESLYSRLSLSLNNEDQSNVPTSKLLENYRKNKRSSYLESLLYQYGRYLLICSSRKGGLPANLQGIWTPYDSSPWSAGYWHNINIQMNYWSSFPSNLADLFIPYDEYNQAYLAKANKLADEYIKVLYPNKFSKDNGWIIGTGGWPYKIEGLDTKSHSGPGTGAFTSLLFYDYYSYTLDKKYLAKRVYPLIYRMSLFLSKCLAKNGNSYLVKHSASPENIIKGGNWNDYYHTQGCAFDQQMVYENFSKTLELHALLNYPDDDLIKFIKKVINHLDPVLIGLDKQIKEYREEKHYADIGEEHHRHISHLVGLYPGSIINDNHPEWMKAAVNTLNYRGDKSTGWALMHRLCCWSRTHQAQRAYDIITSLMKNNLYLNLFDKHPPFQIDGNFGYVAGVSEMLVSTNNGYLELLPCLPKAWKNGYFKGLLAKGAFVVDANYQNQHISKAVVTAKANNTLKIKLTQTMKVYLNNQFIGTKRPSIIDISLKKNDKIILEKI